MWTGSKWAWAPISTVMNLYGQPASTGAQAFLSGGLGGTHGRDGDRRHLRSNRALFCCHLGSYGTAATRESLLRIHQPQHDCKRAGHLATGVHLPLWIPRLRRARPTANNVLAPTLPNDDQAVGQRISGPAGFSVGVRSDNASFPFNATSDHFRARGPASGSLTAISAPR